MIHRFTYLLTRFLNLFFSNCRPKQKLQPLLWSLQQQHQLLPHSIQKVWHLYREEWQSKQRKWKTQKISKSFILELFKNIVKVSWLYFKKLRRYWLFLFCFVFTFLLKFSGGSVIWHFDKRNKVAEVTLHHYLWRLSKAYDIRDIFAWILV